MTIKFREYDGSTPVSEHLIEGRTPSGWLYKNWHRISQEDFYNKDLTEDDLKRMYPEE